MARARKKAASTRGATRSQSRKAPAPAPAVAEVEVVEEEGGLGLEEGTQAARLNYVCPKKCLSQYRNSVAKMRE